MFEHRKTSAQFENLKVENEYLSIFMFWKTRRPVEGLILVLLESSYLLT